MFSAEHVRFGEQALGQEGGVAFVGEVDGQGETLVQAAAEFAGEAGEFVFGAVAVDGQADDEVVGLPFFDEGSDGGEFFFVAAAGYGGQGVGGGGLCAALRHADAFFAEVEGKAGAAWGGGGIRHGLRPASGRRVGYRVWRGRRGGVCARGCRTGWRRRRAR